MSPGTACRAVVLVSGGGSNLQAFIDAVREGRLRVTLAGVASDNPDAFGLTRARRAGLPTEALPRKDYADAAAFDRALAERLEAWGAELVLLAGFMRILGPAFVARFEGRTLNIHPSLLPRFPGLDTHRRAIEAGERWHGCTVHFVTDELDGGPPIAQARVPVLAGDTEATLAARVLEKEHRIYPWVAGLYAAGRLRYEAGAALLDGEPLHEPLQFDPA